MLNAIGLLLAASFLTSFVLTWTMIRVSPRIGFVDKPGHRKIHSAPKPLGGGVAIFWAIVLPLVAAYTIAWLPRESLSNFIGTGNLPTALMGGVAIQTPLVAGVLLSMLAMHVMGLLDDRRAMGAMLKLLVQLGVTAALVVGMEWLATTTPSLRLRALTAMDSWGAGKVPSIALTVLWICAITNAFNFLDNMDGLSAGVAAVCATAFLLTTLLIGQWFVAAMLAVLIGAVLGFLYWNFPPARIFMGDSGSLVVGFLLGVLTVRTTFVAPGEPLARTWHAVFAPLIVLALPLYDLVVVSLLRLRAGRSPFQGDTNHFSHRLVRRGMSRRTAVLCLYLLTAATSISAVVLPHVRETFAAMLIFGQTLLILALVALLEQHPPADAGS